MMRLTVTKISAEGQILDETSEVLEPIVEIYIAELIEENKRRTPAGIIASDIEMLAHEESKVR
jgi:hypothetical protein